MNPLVYLLVSFSALSGDLATAQDISILQVPHVVDSHDLLQCPPGGVCPPSFRPPSFNPPSDLPGDPRHPGLSPQSPPLGAMSKESISKARSSSVKVEVFSNTKSIKPLVDYYDRLGRSISGGSGTHVGNGLIVTNRHVAQRRGASASIEFQDGKSYSGSVVAVSNYSDLAAIYAPNARGQFSSVLASVVPARGSLVFSAGYPAYTSNGGRNPRRITEKQGTMDGAVMVDWNHLSDGSSSTWGYSNRLSMRCSNGDSGSGIFCSGGFLIGVLWGNSGGETLCCTHKDTVRFVEQDCIRWRHPSKPPIDPLPSPSPPPKPPNTHPLYPPERPDPPISPPVIVKDGKDGLPGRDGKDGLPGQTGPMGPSGLTPDLSPIMANLSSLADQFGGMKENFASLKENFVSLSTDFVGLDKRVKNLSDDLVDLSRKPDIQEKTPILQEKPFIGPIRVRIVPRTQP